MALCKELCDDASVGVTFKCVKDCYNMLDIVELEKSSNDDDADDEENLFNPSGYEELAQALRSVIWSNVDMNHGKNNSSSCSATKLIVSDLIKFLAMENLKTDLQATTTTRRTRNSTSRVNSRTSRSFSAG